MSRGRPTALAVAVAALVTTVPGCSGEPWFQPRGPVELGGAAVCVPAPVGGEVLLGTVVRPPAGRDVRLDRLDLVDPVGMEVTGTYVVPRLPGGAFTGTDALPPTGDLSAVWPQRTPVEGTVVRGGESVGLVVPVRRTAAEAHSADVALSYHAGLWSYRSSGTGTYALQDPCGDTPETATG